MYIGVAQVEEAAGPGLVAGARGLRILIITAVIIIIIIIIMIIVIIGTIICLVSAARLIASRFRRRSCGPAAILMLYPNAAIPECDPIST